MNSFIESNISSAIKDDSVSQIDLLRKEMQLLKSAQRIYSEGGNLPELTREVVTKWASADPGKVEMVETVFRGSNLKDVKEEINAFYVQNKCKSASEVDLKQLEASFQELSAEENLLKKQLNLLKRDKILRSQNAKRSPRKRVGLNTNDKSKKKSYEYEVLKRKYADLLKYVTNCQEKDQYINECIVEIERLKKEIQEKESILHKVESFKLVNKASDPEFGFMPVNCSIGDTQYINFDSEIGIRNHEKDRDKNFGNVEYNYENNRVANDYDSHRRRKVKKKYSRKVKNVNGVYENIENDDLVNKSELEDKWFRRITETQKVYEKAMVGYREEAEKSKLECEELREENRLAISNYEKKLDDLNNSYESELNNYKEKTEDIQTHNTQAFSDHSMKLEAELYRKEKELKELKSVTLDDKQCEFCERYTTEGMKNPILVPLTEVSKTLETNIIEAVKGILMECKNIPFDESYLLHCVENVFGNISDDLIAKNENNVKKNSKLACDIKELKEKLTKKTTQIEIVDKELGDFKQKYHELQEKCMNLESKISFNDGINEGIGNLKNFPEMMKESEIKLIETQRLLEKRMNESEVLNQRLEKMKYEVQIKSSRLGNIENEVSDLKLVNSNLKSQIQALESCRDQLQSSVQTKNVILERTSAELEQRITQCATISSQYEKLRAEISNNMPSPCTYDEHYEQKIMNLDQRNSALTRQLSSVRSEKERLEQVLQQEKRILEDRIEHLTLKNCTYQRQIESITSMYKDIFPSEEQWLKVFDIQTHNYEAGE